MTLNKALLSLALKSGLTAASTPSAPVDGGTAAAWPFTTRGLLGIESAAATPWRRAGVWIHVFGFAFVRDLRGQDGGAPRGIVAIAALVLFAMGGVMAGLIRGGTANILDTLVLGMLGVSTGMALGWGIALWGRALADFDLVDAKRILERGNGTLRQPFTAWLIQMNEVKLCRRHIVLLRLWDVQRARWIALDQRLQKPDHAAVQSTIAAMPAWRARRVLAAQERQIAQRHAFERLELAEVYDSANARRVRGGCANTSNGAPRVPRA